MSEYPVLMIDTMLPDPDRQAVEQCMGEWLEMVTTLRAENERLRGNRRKIMCVYCGANVASSDGEKTAIACMKAHDQSCPSNPITAERDTLRAQVERLKEEEADLNEALELHSSLNRRAAEVLGKRTGPDVMDTWHDIPERIALLQVNEAELIKEVKRLEREKAEAVKLARKLENALAIVADHPGTRHETKQYCRDFVLNADKILSTLDAKEASDE